MSAPPRTMTALGTPHDDLLRRALLQRVATALDVVARARHYTCCWLSYTGPGGEPWSWRLCNPGVHAGRTEGPPCDHLHHRHEVFLAGSMGGQ